MKTYIVPLEILQKIGGILQELPYKTSADVMIALNKLVMEQDLSKPPELPVKEEKI